MYPCNHASEWLKRADSLVTTKKDVKNDEEVNAIVRNYDLYRFFKKEKSFSKEDYINFMIENGNKPLAIDLDKFKNLITESQSKKKPYYAEEHFQKYNIFESPLTFGQLDVASENELLEKYFDFNFNEYSGYLKEEYRKIYNRKYNYGFPQNRRFPEVYIYGEGNYDWGKYRECGAMPNPQVKGNAGMQEV